MRAKPCGRFLIIAVVLLATIFTTSSVAAQVQGVVTPNRNILPGQQIAIEFSGFEPNSEVIRWVAPTGNARSIPFSGDIVADNNGVAAWHYTVPDDAQPGVWAIMARAKKAPSSTRATAATFRVLSVRTTVAATASVSPSIGKPQTRFRFTAPGFRSDQRVYAWANGPNDENIDLEVNIQANAQGVASWAWTAPGDSAPGQWRMVIRDTPNADEPLPARYILAFTIE